MAISLQTRRNFCTLDIIKQQGKMKHDKKQNFSLCIFFPLLWGWNTDKAVSKNKDVFSIYLVKNSKLVDTSKTVDLKNFILEDEPLLTVDSITSYTWHSHKIAFSSRVKEGLKKREPLLYCLFVVVANEERIYWGIFKDIENPNGSKSPAIFLLPHNTSLSCIPKIFIISRAPNIVNNIDVRNDKRIYNALLSAGKLLQ